MKKDFCCQCGEKRPFTRPVLKSFSQSEIFNTEKYRPLTRQTFNEVSPQLILQYSVFRNGGTNEETHICDKCVAVALKKLKENIEKIIESFE